jgi:hypothetical protein
VQPQTFNSGNGGQDTGSAAGPAPMPREGELPSPVMPAPLPPQVTYEPATPGAYPEQVLREATNLLEQPNANPKQQADKLADIKRRYQQDVLGLKPHNLPEQGV